MIASKQNTQQSRPNDFRWRANEFLLTRIEPRANSKWLLSWELFGKRKGNHKQG